MNKEKIDDLKKSIEALKQYILNEEAEIKKLEAGNELWYVDQPVIARDEYSPEFHRHLCSETTTYADGRSRYTKEDSRALRWNSIKPDYDAPNIINWMPNSGVEPVIDGDYISVQVIYKDGRAEILYCNGSTTWDLKHSNPIAHYCIIRKPVKVEGL